MAQHFCYPCGKEGSGVGKSTHAVSDPVQCYDWVLKYLNNVAEGIQNDGNGFATKDDGKTYSVKIPDGTTDIVAAEFNEPGTEAFGQMFGIKPMNDEDKALVAKGLRLPTGDYHQAPCAKTGRAAILRSGPNTASVDSLNFSHLGGEEHVKSVQAMTEMISSMVGMVGMRGFGLHHVACVYHSTGPCKMVDIERGVSSQWANNFSQGYVPLMDNNDMFWTATLGPLLDAFIRDGVEFYPMRWDGGHGKEVFSVMASQCGKALIEVAAPEAGGRSPEQFHKMLHPRAAPSNLVNLNDDRKLVPIRISRAIGHELMDKVLDFYGQGPNKQRAAALGFHSRLISDVTYDSDRAVLLELAPGVTLHVQLWARKESSPGGPSFPTSSAFERATTEPINGGSNQVDGGQPASAQSFCRDGVWTVSRYNKFVVQTHEGIMSPLPPPDYDTLHPPAGITQDMFIDEHFAWGCYSDKCDLAAAGKAFYDFGSRVQWQGFNGHWSAYSYDPSGYGVQLHWIYASPGFKPEGTPPGVCWSTNKEGICDGSFPSGRQEM